MVFLPRFGTLVRHAVAAGGGSPVEATAPLATPPLPPEAIPADWLTLSWPKLRALATALDPQGEAISTKAQAIARIEAATGR